MEISPPLGIGDILILKMREVSNKLDIKTIIIFENLINSCRKYPSKYLTFILYLIKMIFPFTEITISNEKKYYEKLNFLNEHLISNTYIYDKINIKEIKIDYSNYIIFHTKFRLDKNLINNFINNDMKKLNVFLNNFKTDKTIILLGERRIEECYEQQVLNIISLYNNFLLLKNNNNVIDLTENELYSGNSEHDTFLRDVELINKSDCNILFGIGGPLNICLSFSKNNICYVSNIYHNTLEEFIKINTNIIRDFQEFLYKLNQMNLNKDYKININNINKINKINKFKMIFN